MADYFIFCKRYEFYVQNLKIIVGFKDIVRKINELIARETQCNYKKLHH